MARKLKTFQTSLGFYDLAIAAPSMKAALEAWGAGSNLFHQGAATETDDPDVVAATMSKRTCAQASGRIERSLRRALRSPVRPGIWRKRRSEG
jgi:colicin import membrane protein